MSLQSKIDPRLWKAIEKSFEDSDYSGAILDSFYFLSDLIRAKSGFESDGAALIGAAFGGQNPLVKINSCKTESEISEQKGIEQLLRGLYLAIRNPRSHEKRTDSIATADHIITFVSYLVGLIDNSKSPFDVEQILRKVFDKHFVSTTQYADALATTIPLGKRDEVLSRLFHRRSEGRIKNVALFTHAILNLLPEGSRLSFWATASSALEEASTDGDFRTAVYIASKHWEKLSDIARLRTENRLIGSIREGAYSPDTNEVSGGNLGTWASGVTSRFLMKDELKAALVERIEEGGPSGISFVLNYFASELFNPKVPPDWPLAYAISVRLDADDKAIFQALWFVSTKDCHEGWASELGASLDSYRKRNTYSTMTDDDIPF